MITAPTAVRTPCCSAIEMNSTTGAPPGSMTKGSFAPILNGPSDCSSEPMPDSTNEAASRLTLSSVDRPRAALTMKTLEIGAAAMTSTCWRPKSAIELRGRYSSTGCRGVVTTGGLRS